MIEEEPIPEDLQKIMDENLEEITAPSGCPASPCSPLTDEDIETITEKAHLTYHRSLRQKRGQTLSHFDGVEYYVIMATVEFLKENRGHDQQPR